MHGSGLGVAWEVSLSRAVVAGRPPQSGVSKARWHGVSSAHGRSGEARGGMTGEGFARRLWRALRARDLIEFIRALSPRFDERVQKKVDEAAAKRSWSYHLFWWRYDRVPYRLRSMLMNVERGL